MLTEVRRLLRVHGARRWYQDMTPTGRLPRCAGCNANQQVVNSLVDRYPCGTHLSVLPPHNPDDNPDVPWANHTDTYVWRFWVECLTEPPPLNQHTESV